MFKSLEELPEKFKVLLLEDIIVDVPQEFVRKTKTLKVFCSDPLVFQ